MPSEQLYVISNRGQGNLQPAKGYNRPLTKHELKAELKVGEADEISQADWERIEAAYEAELKDFEKQYIGHYVAGNVGEAPRFIEVAMMNKAETLAALNTWLETSYTDCCRKLLTRLAGTPVLSTRVEALLGKRVERQHVFVPKIGGGGLVTALKALATSPAPASAGVMAGSSSTASTARALIAASPATRQQTVWVSWVGFSGLSARAPAMYYDSRSSRAISCDAGRAASVAMSANGISAVPVFLSAELHNLHYGDAANGLLWPLNHALVPTAASAAEIKAAYELMVKAGLTDQADAEELTKAEMRRLEQILVDEALLVQCQLYEVRLKAGQVTGEAPESAAYIAAGQAAEKAVYSGYKDACKQFAQAALLDMSARSAGATSQVVWVQDYQMWFVLLELKKRSPQLKLGYFHHIPFPPPAVLKQFPAAAEFLSALLHADFLDFHSSLYSQNFYDCVSDFFGDDVKRSSQLASGDCTITLAAGAFGLLEERTITIGVKPIGVDKARCRSRIADPELTAELKTKKETCLERDLERQRALAASKACVAIPDDDSEPCFGLEPQQPRLFVWVGRLDHTKGLPSTMNVFWRYLKEREAWMESLATLIVADGGSGVVTTVAALLAEVDVKIAACADPDATLGADPKLDILREQRAYLASLATQDGPAIDALRAKLNIMPPALLYVVAPPTRQSVTSYKALIRLVSLKAASQFDAYADSFYLQMKSVPQEGMKALFDEAFVVYVPVYPSDGYNLVVAEAVCSREPGQGKVVVVCDGAGVANQVKPENIGEPGAIVVTTREADGRPKPLSQVELGMLEATKLAVRKSDAEQVADVTYMRGQVGEIKEWGAACTEPLRREAMLSSAASRHRFTTVVQTECDDDGEEVRVYGRETPMMSVRSVRSQADLMQIGPGTFGAVPVAKEIKAYVAMLCELAGKRAAAERAAEASAKAKAAVREAALAGDEVGAAAVLKAKL